MQLAMRPSIFIGLLIAFLGLAGQVHAATTLLPIGQQCFSATTGLNGMVGLLGSVTGGSGYTTGTYGGVPLTGGSGTGATASIAVSGGAVTSLVIQNPGVNYVVGDTLSAAAVNIGGTGSGFSVPVSSIAVNSSLAGGSVNMFVPNTTTPKATWKDPNQVSANTQPIILDANGCAVIYGIGSYRQQVFDSLGNLIFDQLTTDTSAQQNVFWAGTASGTPNAITLTDPGFNGTDGTIINFLPLGTNTGATTISIASSAFTGIAVVKDTTGGPVGLTGGEIVQAGTPNVVSVLYSAVQNNFHLINTAIASASGASAPLCGATGLKITNGATPNSIISLTADQIVMQTLAGLTINRSNVSLTNINITTGTVTSTANGMDGESGGSSQWLNIWAIDNGAAPAGLVSVSATAPTMPSGYTFKCRLGAMRVDGSSNLLRTLQFGSQASYTIIGATNTANYPIMASSTNSAVTFWTSVSTASFLPPTATRIQAILSGTYASSTGNGMTIGIAPNNTATANSTTSPSPCGTASFSGNGTSILGNNATCEFNLESTNIFWGVTFNVSNAANAASVAVYGWKDKVNAN